MNEWECALVFLFVVFSLYANGSLFFSRQMSFVFFFFPPFHSFSGFLFLVMSGNSADSYSEGESEGEQLKEKLEVPSPAPANNPTPTLLYVRKGKNNGRVGRPKKLKHTQPPPPPPPPPPANRRRGSGQPKSGLFGF